MWVLKSFFEGLRKSAIEKIVDRLAGLRARKEVLSSYHIAGKSNNVVRGETVDELADIAQEIAILQNRLARLDPNNPALDPEFDDEAPPASEPAPAAKAGNKLDKVGLTKTTDAPVAGA